MSNRAPTVTTTQQFYYYVCVNVTCAETPIVITVQPKPGTLVQEEPQEPTPQPELTVTNATATPLSLQSGDTITVRATITNEGNASAPSETVRVFWPCCC